MQKNLNQGGRSDNLTVLNLDVFQKEVGVGSAAPGRHYGDPFKLG